MVAVNKMDLINQDQQRFRTVTEEMANYLQEIGLQAVAMIPISARHGDNIAILSRAITPDSYRDSYTGPVAAACGRDETGLVGIVLWNEQIDEIRIGDIVRFESGWCQMRDGELIVSTGMNGRLRIIDR